MRQVCAYALLAAFCLNPLHSAAAELKEANMTFQITLKDSYKIANSVMLEGKERVVSARFGIETPDGNGELDLGELDRVKLDSTMVIVKNTSSVSYLEKGVETFHAQLEYATDGKIRMIVMDQSSSRAALNAEVKQLEKQMVSQLERDGQIVLSVSSDITDYVCERVNDTLEMNCSASVEILISAQALNPN